MRLPYLLPALLAATVVQAQELPTWTIAPRAVEYGADAVDLFQSLRHGRFLPNGDVVVADAGRFGPTGEFRALVGEMRGMFRAERTPLPFTPVPRVAVRSDSLWVAEGYDPALKLWNASLMPLDITANRLLGIARAELDVDQVVVHTITR
ncbi:MAG: hypothetical protein ACRENP_18130 [Longimicrobiales bacterium]